MRAGIFGDIHGNTHALDAVLAAIGDVDEYWVMGDLAAIGADPDGAVERVRSLPNARYVRGNTDRYVLAFDRPAPPDDPDALDEFERGFLWSTARLRDAGHLEWIAALPTDQRLTLPDGTRVLLVHASPGKDDGMGFAQDKPDDVTAAQLLDGCDADLVVVGHTHSVVDRTFEVSGGGVRVINAGPVSNPHPGDDRRAAYAILEADETGYRIEHSRVGYDIDVALAALDASGFPGAPYVKGMLSGSAPSRG